MNTNTRTGIAALIVVIVIIVLALVFARPSKAPAPADTATLTPTATVAYSCDAGKSITAAYYQGETKPATSPDQPPIPGGSVALTLSDGRTMTLPQTISADGTRYANADESFVFWGKGNGALVLENNQQKSYIGCIRVAPDTIGTLSKIYSNSSEGFSLRLPSLVTPENTDGYKVNDTSYKYQALGPGKDIAGVKFTIPASFATATNLSPDSYISVEEIPKTTSCSAGLFLDNGATVKSVTDNGTTYSMATSGDAAAGNRYDETVYAIPGTNPCIAVRYFIHYGAFQNYPAGSITEFDEQALVAKFDQIRRSLVINQ